MILLGVGVCVGGFRFWVVLGLVGFYLTVLFVGCGFGIMVFGFVWFGVFVWWVFV